MKKLLLTALSVLAVSTGYAEDVPNTTQKSQSYGYKYVGGLIPTAGVGYRSRLDKQTAVDVSFEVSSILVFNRSLINVKYLNYYDDNNYLGVGVAGGAISWVAKDDYGDLRSYAATVFAPVFTRGWESDTTFVEINMYCPTMTSVGNSLIPSFSISKGWKF